MRAALWIAVLVALFVLAWQVQDRWLDAQRAERDAAYARAPARGGTLPEGFGRVVVGAPSGAEPIEAPARATTAAERPPGAGSESAQPVPGSAGLRRHVVKPGESLSKICAAVYGTSRKPVVEALARANALPNPGAIRAGQELVLPPLAELSAPPR